MQTVVVNLRCDDFDVYIGRPGKGLAGIFGSPIKMYRPCPECGLVHRTRGSTLACFRQYFVRRCNMDPTFWAAVWELRGKRIGCFCKPHPCHGDVIADILNSYLVE